MRELALLGWQVRYEQRAFWRNRRAAVFTFVFPIMLLLIFGFLNTGARLSTRGGISFVTFFVPGILAYAIVTTSFSNLVVTLALARDQGIIKRVQGTPLPWWTYVAGRIGSTLLVVAAMVVLVLAIGVVAFGVHVRVATLPALAVSILLGAACFTALGIGFTRLLPTADSAGPIQAAVVMPIAFISGTFFPLDGAPRWLIDVANLLPLHPLANALQTAFDPRTTGSGFVGADLLRLAIWTLIGVRVMLGVLRSLTRSA